MLLNSTEFESTPMDVSVSVGSSQVLSCQSFSADRITWQKDDVEITPSARFQVLRNGYLVISAIEEGDKGQYTCVAHKTGGCSKEVSAWLTVITGSTISESKIINLQCRHLIHALNALAEYSTARPVVD